MKIEKIVEEIRKEADREIEKIFLSLKSEINNIEKETEERLKELEEKWKVIKEKELTFLKEKNKNEIEKEAETILLKKKNEILNEFKEYAKKRLLDEDKDLLKEFFLNEIVRNCETGKEKIKIGKDFKKVFDKDFKKRLKEAVREKFGEEKLDFEDGEETEVVGEGFIVTVSPIKRLEEEWKDLFLELPEVLFSEEEK